MLMKKKYLAPILTVIMLVSIWLAFPAQAAAVSGDPDGGFGLGSGSAMLETGDYLSHSKAGILYEATTDTVIYAKNADMQLPPASMTKVMTAILVLEENPELEGELTVDERAVSSMYCSSMVPLKHLKAGEIISYKDCMRYLLVPSGNEAATAFAFEIGGDMNTFLDMMNEKARELGCENTNFKDPTGISANDHYTTPEDMVRMCRYAMSFDQFREAVSYPDGEVQASNVRDEGFTYETTNFVMFPDDRYESPYARYMTGIKTGWTPVAGYCFSGCMEKDGLVFYSVAMGGEELMYKDGQRIVQGDFLDTIELYTLTDGLRAEGPDTTPEDMTATSILGAGTFHVKLPDGANILVQDGQTVTAEYDIPSTVFGPVSEGDTVGTVTLKAGDTEKTVDLVAASSRGISPLIIGGAAAIVATAAVIILKMSKHKNNV